MQKENQSFEEFKDVEFKAFRVIEEEPKKFVRQLVTRKVSDISEQGDVLIKVHFSCLNYKDMLSCQGNRGVTKKFPHTPGIDAAGVVISSQNESVKVGDKVIVTGYKLGMSHDGGYSEYICVPAAWVVQLPQNMTLKESMMYGTAGLTAALCVNALLNAGQQIEEGPIVVTGAAGGVGSVACLILKKIGFEVIGATSNIEDSKDFIGQLGIDSHVDKSQTSDESKRPMGKEKWSGAIDVIGGNTLSTLVKSCKYGGNIACIGNVGGHELNMSVYPFILRAISLIGVDSGNVVMKTRQVLWNKLADEWKSDKLESVNKFCTLDNVDEFIKIMEGKKSRGHVVIQICKE